MIYYYLKMAFRNLLRNKIFSIINILGLSIGISSCLFVMLYVLNEYSYEKNFSDYERIYRVLVKEKNERDEITWNTTPPLAASIFNSTYSDIETAIHVTNTRNLIVKLQDGTKYFEENAAVSSNKEFFNVFDLKMVFGGSRNQLNAPNSVVLSKSISEKYFGLENPVGMTLHFDQDEWLITGVFEDIPNNSHLPNFHFITPFEHENNEFYDNWDGIWISTYVKIKPNVTKNKVENELKDFAHHHYSQLLKNQNMEHTYLLQEIKDIHLEHSVTASANKNKIIVFSVVAFIILIISCVNYINLSVSNGVTRSIEVCIRKITGSNKKQLVFQYINETILIVFISLMISLVLIELLIPQLNLISDKSISIKNIDISYLLFSVGFVIVITSIIAGSYPAFILSRLKPIKLLKNEPTWGKQNSSLKKSLVIFQFLISSTLVVATVTIYQQTKFMQNYNLGFEKDKLLVIPMLDQNMSGSTKQNLEAIKTELISLYAVSSVTAHLNSPGQENRTSDFNIVEKGEEIIKVTNQFVDFDFFKTYKLTLLAGRFFDENYSTDKGKSFIINESAVKRFGFVSAEDAIGREITYWGGNGKIIGVIKNFHYLSLKYDIGPLVFHSPEWFVPEALTLNISTKNISETLNMVKGKWQKFYPDHPFEYYFVDQDFNKLYADEENFSKLFAVFSIVAIFIAIIGLIGLVSFTTRTQVKEIGIRKVLGASIAEIVRMVTNKFLILVVAGIGISFPVGYVIMRNWLDNYAYRIELNFLLFLYAGLLVLVIALVTVVFQVYRAALLNPVDSLRNE